MVGSLGSGGRYGSCPRGVMMQTSTAKRQAEEQVGERRATFEEPGRPASERRPAFIVQLGGTDIALEPEVAADIFVVPN